MTQIWRYDSVIGPLYIKALKDGTFAFIYDDVIWDTSNSPEAVAENVYMHVTGCSDWDLLQSKVSDPTDLSEWESISLMESF